MYSLYAFTASINSYTSSNNASIAQLYAETGLSKAEVRNFQKYVSSGYINPSGMSTIKTPRTGFGSVLPPRVRGRQTGGLIGSRLSDTIPGYMEGGLYNSPIVQPPAFIEATLNPLSFNFKHVRPPDFNSATV